MYLTVSDVALAVSKSQDYVRRRIHQNRLVANREGRRFFVDQFEAARWAHESGLPFVLTVPNPGSIERIRCRVARLTVLAWHPNDKAPVNLFTHIRHRRYDSLGPWAAHPDGSWSKEMIPINDVAEPGELRMYRLDAPFEHCQSMINGILIGGVLGIDGIEIKCSLEHEARRYWAYRDSIGRNGLSVLSPFSNYSAEVIEAWSFNDELQQRWQELTTSPPSNLQTFLNSLKFPLDKLPERVGNLMIAGAEDEISCDLQKHRDNSLLLKVDRTDGTELPPDTYTASVWANHGDDNVVRRQFSVTSNQTLVELPSDIDQIGFAIYRNSDGRCIDWMDDGLMMSANFAVHLNAGPTVTMHDSKRSTTNRVSLGNSRFMINVEADQYSLLRDRRIRQIVLGRRAWERETEARHARNLARFGPGQLDEAVDYLLDLLRRHSYSDQPIYLADPYFMTRGPKSSTDKLYLGIFETTIGRPLRIICGRQEGGAWWSSYPPALIGHATVRSFTKNAHPLFHDRYLITPEREILITNSISGWNSDGVTFAALPYGVYREEAEARWAMAIGKHSDGTHVCDVK